MTKDQYQDYEKAVATFLERNSVKPGCHSSDPMDQEPFFSWRPCGCCGSALGGNREHYTFAVKRGAWFGEDICLDCVYYLAYGTLDDTTMMEMEEDTPLAD